jgi:cytoskeletal protein RodZ
MPLANTFLLCALVFLGAPSIRVFCQESQSPEASPKPDQAQEAPKPAPKEPSKPEQSTPPAPDQQTQNPPAASQPPQPPPAELAVGSTEKKSTVATTPAEKQSSGATKSTPSGGKCKAPNSGPRKRIVSRGSTTDPTIQFSPGLTQQQASAQRQNTSQLLAGTDANLKKVSIRQLTPAQQDAVNQIRRYMEQAKAADAAGDLQRAHNLAFKARLLSDELLRK